MHRSLPVSVTNQSDSSKNIPAYNFFYWGPLLFKIKLRHEDLEKCTKLCSKKSSCVRDTLAGIIKHEHHVGGIKYYKILEPYLDSFRDCHKAWYGRPLTKRIVISMAWVNFMVAGEFNPPHIHSSCDFSSVLFIKIPEKLKEEHKAFTGTGGGPGAISFTYGESQPHIIDWKSFLPQEGDLFIFPATLKHFVSSFTSQGERISISANFRFD